MSKFLTSIPVDVEGVRRLLPAGAYINRVTWNPDTSRIEVHWEHDHLETGFTFSLDFGRELLEQGKLPEHVQRRNHGSAAWKGVQTPEGVNLARKGGNKPKQRTA